MSHALIWQIHWPTLHQVGFWGKGIFSRAFSRMESRLSTRDFAYKYSANNNQYFLIRIGKAYAWPQLCIQGLQMWVRCGLEHIKFIWSLCTSFSICESTLHFPEVKIDILGYYGDVEVTGLNVIPVCDYFVNSVGRHWFHRLNLEWLFSADLGFLPLYLVVQGLSVFDEELSGSYLVPREKVLGKAGLHVLIVHAFNIFGFVLSNFCVHLILRIGTDRNKSTKNSIPN